jgi:hypothetical protein
MNAIENYIEEFMKQHIDNRRACTYCKYMLAPDKFKNNNVMCNRCINHVKKWHKNIKSTKAIISYNYYTRTYSLLGYCTYEYLGCSTDEYISYLKNMLDEETDIDDYMITWKTIFVKPVNKLMTDEQIIKRLHYSNISIKYL